MSRPAPPELSAFPYRRVLPTRWMDNDLYGHVNNVHYYSFFDTVIAYFLIEEGRLDPWRSEVVGMAVESTCRFHASISFPEPVTAGLRVGHLGRTSCRYEIGIFKGDSAVAAADGHFVHVFVDRASQRPHPIPESIRAALARILADGD